MAFFDAPKVSEDEDNIINLKNSDEERINFAKFYLEDLRFLYKDCADEDKKVSGPEHNLDKLSNNIMILIEMEGALSQPLCPPGFRCPSWHYRGICEGSSPPS